MHRVVKQILLLAVLTFSSILAGCGGGGSAGGGSSGIAAEYFVVDGTIYPNGSMVHIEGYLDQTSPNAYITGGPVGVVWMSQLNNMIYFEILSGAAGWPGTYSLSGIGAATFARITDTSVVTGGSMLDLANGSGTGGSLSIGSFGNKGQQITGSFNVTLCDAFTVCSTSTKNYTGTFSATRTDNYGSITKPALLNAYTPPMTWGGGIHPVTGKNYYVVTSNTIGGTLTLTNTPTVDVNMAVFTDAGFTTPAICNVTSTLNVVGSGVETCAITVTANQMLYLSISQATAATAFETYSLTVAE
ncbi:MAG: hypothetical protein WC742_04795 [Gallionellaceae bacterium]|jgi:hypothetical protein